MAIHPVFIHFHTGILTANAVLCLIMIVLRVVFREAINTPGTKMARIFHELDLFIFWGNIIGLLGLFGGMVTGLMDWPLQALLANAYMRAKMFWSIMAVQIYLFLVIVRAKLGDKIWKSTSGFMIYGVLGIVGGAMIILMGALGGIAVYGTSILEPVLDWLGMPWP